MGIPAGKYHPSWAPLFTELQKDVSTEKFWRQLYLVLHAEYDIYRQIQCKEKISYSEEPKTLDSEKSITQFIRKYTSHWDEADIQLRVKSFSSGVGTISVRTFGIEHPSWKPLIKEMEQSVMQIRFWQKLIRLTSLEIKV